MPTGNVLSETITRLAGRISLQRSGLQQLVELLSNWEKESSDLRIELTEPEDEPSRNVPMFKRASELWYPDGNLVICAGSLGFRVYRGMLAEQSSCLEELLSPAELRTCDVFEGCPVLYVWHNSTEVYHFLNAIFKPRSFDPLLKRNLSFDAITAVYNLSQKYKIRDLQRKSLTLLSEFYPTNLVEFTAEGFTRAYCRDQIIPVILFARTHNVDWILPLAFYRYCLELAPNSFVDGVEYNGQAVCMSAEDKKLCMSAERLMNHTNRVQLLKRYRQRLNEPAGCTGGDECRCSRFSEADRLLVALTSPHAVFDTWEPEPESNMCATCFADTEEWYDERQQTFWEGLPAMFGLPDWGTLNEMKEAALRDSEEEGEGMLPEDDNVTW